MLENLRHNPKKKKKKNSFGGREGYTFKNQEGYTL
jgi:hypothetical protein